MGPERRKVFEMHRFLSHQFQLRDRGLKAASKSGQRYQESVKRPDLVAISRRCGENRKIRKGLGDGTQAARNRVMRNILIGLFAAAMLLVTGVVAQHEEHHPDQATPATDKAAGMPMMSQMMGQMMPMMASHAEAATLADKLVTGFAAIENEKNAKARDEKLAEHGKLLKELQANLKGQAQMMEHMHGMMMGGATPAGGKKQ